MRCNGFFQITTGENVLESPFYKKAVRASEKHFGLSIAISTTTHPFAKMSPGTRGIKKKSFGRKAPARKGFARMPATNPKAHPECPMCICRVQVGKGKIYAEERAYKTATILKVVHYFGSALLGEGGVTLEGDGHGTERDPVQRPRG